MTYLLSLTKNAIQDFSRNKLRTILTSLGILIGVSSVVLLLAFGLGLKAYIQSQFESLGSNLVLVLPGAFAQGGAGFRPGTFGSIRFDERDLRNLKKIKDAQLMAGAFAKTVRVSSSGESQSVDIFATSADYFPVRNFEIDQGRLFNDGDVDKKSKVAVLGPKIAEKLYGNASDSLTKSVKIEGQAYSVIGVLKGKGGGGFGGPDIDSFVYVPYTAAYQFNPDKTFIAFYIKSKDDSSIADIKLKASQILGKRYKKDDFSVVEQTEILSTITSIFGVLNMILVAIGAISLIVGGVGIMNIMYVTVSERIKEIGVRRAVGATKRDVLMQFLVEATTLSLLGGLMGLAVSFAVVLAVQRFFPAYIDLASILSALFVSSGVGIVFGVLPAKKAADLSPIEAIRYE